MGGGRRTSLVAAASASLFIVALPATVAVAASIVGTDGAETIRGTPGADRISARAGDDRIFGLAGDDVLTGGPGRDVLNGGAGADRLLVRDGVRDVAGCGPGRDVVVGDGADVVLGDCETLRISPPEPQAPPPRPVVAGVYGGRTTQGELVSFQVSSGGTLSKLVLPVIDLSCSPPGGPSVTWSQDFGAATAVVQRDGMFTIAESGVRGSEGGVATYRIVVSGLLTFGIATGSVEVVVELTLAKATYACRAPGLRWTAAAATLTGP
jgi:RTX calcium-binding nonapeptide repeat (4 copies)